jgi:formate-dependent nitrite reductase membrane component NrfD
MAYGLCAAAWFVGALVLDSIPVALMLIAALLAIGTASYSAFLFAQAEGRELWQSPLFFWQLIVQAAAAGSATMLIVGALAEQPAGAATSIASVLEVALAIGLGMTLVEVYLPASSEDVRLARAILVRGSLRSWFWGGAVAVGAIVPLSVLRAAGTGAVPACVASALALAGLWIWEWLWLRAGQAVRLS